MRSRLLRAIPLSGFGPALASADSGSPKPRNRDRDGLLRFGPAAATHVQQSNSTRRSLNWENIALCAMHHGAKKGETGDSRWVTATFSRCWGNPSWGNAEDARGS